MTTNQILLNSRDYVNVQEESSSLKKVLVFNKATSEHFKRLSAVLFSNYTLHRVLQRNGVTVNAPCAYGFILNEKEEKEGTEVSCYFGTRGRDMSLFELAGSDFKLAVDFLQHLIIAYNLDVPYFVAKDENKIKVNVIAVNSFVDKCDLVIEELCNNKGYRASVVCKDGFVLSESKSSTLIQINNNKEMVIDGLKTTALIDAKEKAWEYFGVCMHEWAMQCIAQPLHSFTSQANRYAYLNTQ